MSINAVCVLPGNCRVDNVARIADLLPLTQEQVEQFLIHAAYNKENA